MSSSGWWGLSSKAIEVVAYKTSHRGIRPSCSRARSQVGCPKLEGHSSGEQAPARCTSLGLSTIQSETAWASCEEAPDKLQGRGCKRGNTTHEANSTKAAPRT